MRYSRLTARAELAQARPDPTECTEVNELLSKMLQLEPEDRPEAMCRVAVRLAPQTMLTFVCSTATFRKVPVLSSNPTAE